MRSLVKSAIIASVVVIAATLALFWFFAPGPATQNEAPLPLPLPQAQDSGASASAVTKEAILAKVAALGDASPPAARLQMVTTLAKLGRGSESVLASALLAAPSLQTKTVIADAIASIGTSEAVDALMSAIASTHDPATRQSLARAFDALPPGQPVETLASSLATLLDPPVRDAVIATIARSADASTVQFLTELYREPEAFVGQSANVLAAIAAIHNAEATESLKTLLATNREVPVMAATARALGKIGTAESLHAIAGTLESLGTTNPALRQQFLAVLEAVENPDAVEWLQKAAHGFYHDPDLAKAANVAVASIQKQPR